MLVKFIHTAVILATLGVVASCGEKEVVLEGPRIGTRAVLQGEDAQEPADRTARAVPLSLPPAQVNAAWTHRNGSAAHRLAHPALSAQPTLVFSAPIGQGNDRKHRIAADPVVSDGRIFTLDSRARVVATATNGARLWEADLTPQSDKADDASGGGIAVEGGRVFVTTGFGRLQALDAATGAVIWRQQFDVAVGGAPAVAGGIVYVVARDASAWAVRASDGRVVWQFAGTPALTGVTGASAPAISDDLAIFPFASGELVAVDRASGTRSWSAQVGGSRLGRAYATTTELSGDPVVVGDTVYAGSFAGRLGAYDARTGAARWAAPEGAVGPVWPVGDALFMVNDEARLVRLDAATGDVVWSVDMPYFTKRRSRSKGDHCALRPGAGGRAALGRLFRRGLARL